MATDFGNKWGSVVSLVVTNLVSLGSGAGWQSAARTTGALSVDELVSVRANGNTAGATGTLDLYVASQAKETGGVTYADGASGTEGAFTAANRKNARYLGSVQLNGTSAVQSSMMSVAAAFGGFLPPAYCLIAINNSGAALGSTSSEFSVEIKPVLGTTA